MKKFLSLLGLMAVLGMSAPAFAAPPPPRGPMGAQGGQVIHAGAGMHRQPHYDRGWGAPPPPRGHFNRGNAVIGGVLVRRSCWNNYFYDSRMSFCDDYVVRPHFGGGIYIRF